MRIKKTFQGNLPENTVVNTQSNSQVNTYSCDYLNGKIISESGSNSNGNYIKFEDGTMICTKTVTSSVAMTSAWSSLYEGSQSLGSFAKTFISTPQVFVTNVGANIGAIFECFSSPPTTSSAGTVYWCRPNSITANVTTNVMAIGKWK